MTPNMAGKRVAITGANSGIGKAAALELARAGAEVVLVCRDATRGAAAITDIQAETGSERLALMLCDISSQADIRRFCAEFRERYETLDVLLNNAGAYFSDRRESADGLELTFALNHMGYFLVSRGLGPCLEATAGARVVNVSSAGHRLGSLNVDDLQWSRRRFNGLKAYSDTKLMNILFTQSLAERWADIGVTVNSLHPGAIRSGFAVSQTGLFAWGARLLSPLLTSPEKGARASIYLASSPEVAVVTGSYFVGGNLRKPSGAARKSANAEALWRASEAVIAHDSV